MNNTAPLSRPAVVLFAVLLLLSTSGCKTAAKIANFAVSPTSVISGEKAQLCYELTNAASARVEPAVGELSDRKKGCLNVEPRETTTYTLSATGEDGQTITRQVILDVQAPPPVAAIALFEARREPSASAAPGSQAELCYEVRGASSLRIEPDVGAVEPPDRGCRTVSPGETTTYKLTAAGPDDRPVSQEATVKVVYPPARIVKFEPSATAIKAGDRVRLCYRIEDATGADIENVDYAIKLGQNDCVVFPPPRTNNYTLVAWNRDGRRVSKEWRVTVDQPPPEIVSFAARSAEVEKGNNAVLHYEVTRASRARIAHGDGTANLQQAAGDFTHRPARTTTYTLTVENLDGETASNAVEVKVVPPAQARLKVGTQTPVIAPGQAATLCYGATWGSKLTIYSAADRTPRDLESSENKCITVRPAATDTYTLTATGPNGQPVNGQVTITVKAPPLAAEFVARAANQSGPKVVIPRGDAAQLCYRTANATGARIIPVFNDVQLSAQWQCLTLPPQQTNTTYTLSVRGLDGATLTRQATVELYPAPVISLFEVRPINGRQHLCYDFGFARSAQIMPQIPGVPTNVIGPRTTSGKACIPRPETPASAYTLTVKGFGNVPPAVASAKFPPR